MKIGVIQFPGSNCERETKLALQRVGFEAVDCFWHADADLVKSLDGFVIVGGFSYEDRVRSGLIASKDPFMRLICNEAAKGKPILGICNGAQILVESGLLGGPIALTQNQRVKNGELLGTGFYNDWVEIKSNRAPTNQPIRLPIAHAEGRFLLDPTFYQALQQKGALLYTYCGENPNGSEHHLAAVSDKTSRVMAMMPHPERTTAGDIIFKSFFEQALEGCPINLDPIVTPSLPFTDCVLNPNAYHAWVALKIDDNEAISLENTLQDLGYSLPLKRLVHWEISNITAEEYQHLKNSDELLNHQKEYLSEPKMRPCYLVRAKDDEQAFRKQLALTKMLNKSVQVKRDVVWISHQPLPQAIYELLGNPLSHSGLILS
ncbi:MAG: hypothetical protein A3F46_09830 [Legionellales bacterium RIFCSPHIGHO2_12_FULL_42_9]|nr:MAG: hypothetical protein A3F46_09830 [Legionellales bacterium RIFCSPHIGHO2_12_FULL_42_9]